VDDPASKPEESDATAHTIVGRYGLDPYALKAMQDYALHHQMIIEQALRSFDALMPSALWQAQLAAASDFARTLTGPSVLTGLREAMRAQGEVQRILASTALIQFGELKGLDVATAYANRLTGLSAAITLVQELPSSTAIAQASAAARRVERLNTASLTSWRRLIVQSPVAVVDLVRLEAAGRTTYGLANASALITRAIGPSDAPGKAWLTAPAETRDELLLRLRELDAALPAKLHGAWDRTSRPGPSAASQAAGTLVELIDWSLRLAAPDQAVLEWHASENRSAAELHEGGPTRGLRVRFLLRYRGADGVAADTYTKHLAEILKLLQGGKHRLEDEDLTIIRCTIPSVEGLLSFVLLAGTTSVDVDSNHRPRNS
jgi:hypothetical protein